MPALLGRRADRRHAALATPLPLAAAAYFFPVFMVTLIVNDKGNLHSVWFPAHIWILYKPPFFFLSSPSNRPFAFSDRKCNPRRAKKQCTYCHLIGPLLGRIGPQRVCCRVSAPQQERINPDSNHRKFIKYAS